MGFGISDEVLEKIIMEPWLIPSDFGCGSSYSRVHQYTPSSTRSRIYASAKPVTTELPRSNANTKEQDNIAFIKAVVVHVRDVYESGLYKTLHSGDVKTLFDNIKEYFESTALALKISVESDANIAKNERKSIDYIFKGIAEQIFYIITHEGLNKIEFRNIVGDFYALLTAWHLNTTAETVKKKVFFSYYVSEFGLSESKYHCCPHCGANIYSGINNCPSCFKNIHDTPTLPAEVAISTVTTNIASDKTELDKLQEQLKAAQDTIAAQMEQHSDEISQLMQSIESLQRQIHEKDQAISAYKNHLAGALPESNQDHLKILIVGDYSLSEQETKHITDTVGIAYEALEFYSDYNKIKNFAARIKGDAKYSAIVVGAVPHKVKNLDGASSLSTLFKRDGYPFVVEARTYQGELKLSRESFQRALSRVAAHLMTRGMLPL